MSSANPNSTGNAPATNGAPEAPPIWLTGIGALVLLTACSQARLGPVPVATVVVFLCLLAVLAFGRRHLSAPLLPWTHGIMLAALCLGLAGLSRAELGGGLRELLQATEVFVVAWYLFTILRRSQFSEICRVIAWIVLFLLVAGPGGWYRLAPLELSDAKYAALIVIGTPFLLAHFAVARPRSIVPVALLAGGMVGIAFVDGGMLIAWTLVTVITLVRLSGLRRLPVAVGAVALMLAASVWAMPKPTAWHTLSPAYDGEHTRRLYIEYEAALQAPRDYPLGGGLGRYISRINYLRLQVPKLPHPAENKIRRDSNSQFAVTLVESGWPAVIVLVVLLLLATFRRSEEASDAVALPRHVAATTAVLGVLLAACFCTVLSRGTDIWVGAVLGLTAVPAGDRGRWARRLILPVGMFVIVLMAIGSVAPDHADPLAHISPLNRAVQRLWHEEFTYDKALVARADYFTEYGLPVFEPTTAQAANEEFTVHIEAEDYDLISGGFRLIKANDASGDRVLAIPSDAGKAIGRALYRVQVPQEGTYRFVARVMWQDGCSNSIAFDIGDTRGFVSSELFGVWHELTSRQTYELPVGPVEVTIQNIEDDVQIDYMRLIRTGPGAAASP